jgi:hypothetical protein
MENQDTKGLETKGEAQLPEHPVMIIQMWSGLVLVGYLLGENRDGAMVLQSPLKYQAIPQPGGNVSIAMSELAIKGCSDPDNVNKHVAPPPKQMMWADLADENMQKVYVDSLQQLKAQKAGIQIVKPGDVKLQ